MSRSRVTLAATATALVLATGPVTLLAADGPRTVAVDLHATRLPDRAVVVHEGTVTSVRLPEGARLERLAASRGGWTLTAVSEPAASTSEILVWVAEPSGITKALPPLAVRAGSRSRDPVPLLDRAGALDGLVWLEGPDPQSLAVRFAHWNGAAWLPSEEVAGPAPGSQLALDAATLADGSRVVVWSRYDGGDDEIFWSVIDEKGRAREPRRLLADNDVPDITPAVIATVGGPLVAWSRYDGRDYRLHLARLDGTEWRLIDTLPGRGAFLPRWQRSGDGALYLVYRDGGRRTWTTVRLDDRGTLEAIARVRGDGDGEPRIERLDGETVLVLDSLGPVPLEWQPVPRLP